MIVQFISSEDGLWDNVSMKSRIRIKKDGSYLTISHGEEPGQLTIRAEGPIKVQPVATNTIRIKEE